MTHESPFPPEIEGLQSTSDTSYSSILGSPTDNGGSENERQKDNVDCTNTLLKGSSTLNNVSQHSTESKSMQGTISLHPSFLQRPPSNITIRQIYTLQTANLGSSTDSEDNQVECQTDEIDDATTSFKASNATFSTSCIECVKPYQVVEGDEIQAGDHIIYAGVVYDHHAIVISVKPSVEEPQNEKKRQVKVVHASNTSVGVSAGITKFFGGKAKIMRTTEEVDFQKSKILVVKYIGNQFTREEIVQRAIHELENLGTNEANFKYNLFENNCEHFATWCVTGQKLSVQVRKFRMIISMVWSIGWQCLGVESKRNDVAYDRGLLCKPCYERNKKLFAVPKTPIRSSKDVSVGDIITYSSYKLSHDAIVMEIKNSSKIQFHVLVAHYAYCGLFAHRTIKQEPLVMPFDGSVTVTDYSKSEYSIYPPEEVVTRAKSRLDEQLFAFFANDSCHFARWCKLRRINVKAFTPSKQSQMPQKLNSGECDGCEV